MADIDTHPSESSSADEAQTTERANAELTARRAVAHAVRHTRRWDEPGILTAFDTAVRRGHDFTATAVALLEAAVDPTAKTPAVIVTRLANGWRKEAEPPTPLPRLDRCTTCHLRHPAGTPCGNPNPTPAEDGLQACRQAVANARAGLCVHGVPRTNCHQHDDEKAATP